MVCGEFLGIVCMWYKYFKIAPVTGVSVYITQSSLLSGLMKERMQIVQTNMFLPPDGWIALTFSWGNPGGLSLS